MNIKNYDVSTQRYIKKIEKFLRQKYGVVKSEWEAMIVMFADNLELYQEIRDSIKENGIYDSTRGVKNPLLSTLKDLQATMTKQIQHLGLSPYAVGRLIITDEPEDNLLAQIMDDDE